MVKRNIRQLNSVFINRVIAWASWSTALVATSTVLAKPAASAATPPAAASSAANASATSNSFAAGQASVEASTPGEKRAAKLASDATGPDFRAGHHPAAEKKLREAIQICLVQSCSDPFKARLHRDLGFVYVAGMKRVEDGKDEFTAALTADSTVVLTPAMEEKPAVKQAFGEVKGAMSSAQTSAATSDAETSAAKEESEPEAKPDAKKDSKQEDSEATRDTAAPPEVKAARAFLNWFSLAIEQDIVFHSQTPNACSTGSHYTCFDRKGMQVPVNNFVPGGNQVSGGLASGTWRILLGYDRVFATRFSVGLKLGSVISGKPEIAPGQSGFKYFHAEGRAAIWLSRDPFATSGLRPYIFLSGGLAETASKILVEYSAADCPGCKLNAYKRSGYEFVGAGAGIQYAITPRSGPTLEARYMQFFGPAVPAIGVQLGYAFGI